MACGTIPTHGSLRPFDPIVQPQDLESEEPDMVVAADDSFFVDKDPEAFPEGADPPDSHGGSLVLLDPIEADIAKLVAVGIQQEGTIVSDLGA